MIEVLVVLALIVAAIRLNIAAARLADRTGPRRARLEKEWARAISATMASRKQGQRG